MRNATKQMMQPSPIYLHAISLVARALQENLRDPAIYVAGSG